MVFSFLWWIRRISTILVPTPSMPEMWIETSHHIVCNTAHLSDSSIDISLKWHASAVSSHNDTIHLIQIFLRSDLRNFLAFASSTKSIQHVLFSWFIMLVKQEWDERCRILHVHNKDKLHEAAVLWTETFIYGKSAWAL